MARKILPVFFLLVVLIYNAEGSLQLNANPTDVSPGLTQSLTVNCSFTYGQVSNISGIISLILAKAPVSENQQETFQDLVSINAFSPDQVNVLSQVNASILGLINGNDESFLTIQWTNPQADQGGLYRCEAHGMDNAGYPSELIQTVMVTSGQPDTNQLMEKITDLQRQLDRQENLTNHLVEQLDRLENKVTQQSELIDSLLSQSNNQSQAPMEHVNLTEFADDFHVSVVHNGHVYLLSKEDWNQSDVAEQTYQDNGGYLAQIEDASEDFIVNAFLDSIPDSEDVLVSGTDEGHQGVWTYTGSSLNMTYIDWYISEPDTPFIHCISKERRLQWKFSDYPCSHVYHGIKFLCEVDLQ